MGPSGGVEVDVPRVDASMGADAFESDYYLPQRPVVVSGVTKDWSVDAWTPESLLRRLAAADPSRIERRAWWFDLAGDVLRDEYRVPDVFQRLTRTRSIDVRKRNVRLWIANKGTVSGWHYDGNGVQGLNVQVRGRKRFDLISPRTPLRCLSFSNLAREWLRPLESLRVRPLEWATVELRQGDMLFLPQYWFHRVVSLDHYNVNVNWVWTDPELALGSATPVADMERERLAGVYLLIRLCQRMGLSVRPKRVRYVREFGGQSDFAYARSALASGSLSRVALRILGESSRLLPDRLAKRRHSRLETEQNQGVPRGALDYFQKTGAEVPGSLTSERDRSVVNY
jgi:hypothetical protein